jgi:RNA polymerase sigma factor (TIGR02999 family)
VARAYRRKVGEGDTLRTTALVHEAYVRLVDIPSVDWNDRVHFFALSAKLMRHILVDAARARGAAKRGGPIGVFHHPNLDEIPAPDSERASVLIALDEALSRLTEFDPRRARIVELRVFGGLSVEETTQALGLSPRSVIRDWNAAKAWLMRELSGWNASA